MPTFGGIAVSKVGIGPARMWFACGESIAHRIEGEKETSVNVNDQKETCTRHGMVRTAQFSDETFKLCDSIAKTGIFIYGGIVPGIKKKREI